MREKRYDQGLNYSWDSRLTDVFFLDVVGFWKARGDVLTCSPTGKFFFQYNIVQCFHWSEIQSTLFRISQNALLTMDSKSNVLFLKPITGKN